LLLQDRCMISKIWLCILKSRIRSFGTSGYIADVNHVCLSLIRLGLIQAPRRGALLHAGWGSSKWTSTNFVLGELFKHLPLFLDVLFVLIKGSPVDCRTNTLWSVAVLKAALVCLVEVLGTWIPTCQLLMISLLNHLCLQRTPLSFVESVILVSLIRHHVVCPFDLRVRSLPVLLDLCLRLLQHICVKLVLCLAQ